MKNTKVVLSELNKLKLTKTKTGFEAGGRACTIDALIFQLNGNPKIDITEGEKKELSSMVDNILTANQTQKDKAIFLRSAAESKIKLHGKLSGEFYPHELRYIASNDLDETLLKPFFWAKDPTGEGISIFVQDHEQDFLYKKLILSTSVTQNENLLKAILAQVKYDSTTSIAKRYTKAWQSIISDTSMQIRRQFSGLNSPEQETVDSAIEQIYAIITKMLPSLALNNMLRVDYYTQTTKDGEIVYTDVNIRRRGDSPKQVTVYEYLTFALSALPTMAEKEIEWPAIYSSEEGENTLCYFPLKTYLTQPRIETPAWTEFGMKYTTDEWKVFKSFMYSIFYSKNKSRQCLYQQDNGFSGKSVLQSVLVHYLGSDTTIGLQKDSLGNQFSMSKIWDKRLLLIGDNKNKRIIHTEKIHMILGGDYCDIEYKGRNSFSAKLGSKLIINGNVAPYIDGSATHERTRLILIKPTMTKEVIEKLSAKDEKGNVIYDSFGNPQLLGDPNFVDNLIKEFPSFLQDCKESYDELCPSDANITLPASMVEDLYSLGEEEEALYDEVMASYFILQDGFCKKADAMKIWRENAERFGLDKSTRGYSNFIEYNKKRGVTESQKRMDGKKVNVYKGLCLSDLGSSTVDPRPESAQFGITTPK